MLTNLIDQQESLVGRVPSELQRAWRKKTNRELVLLFQKMCDALAISEMIECGAREASASRAFVRQKDGRRAIAIEANPLTFREITLQDQLPQIRYINAAVSSTSGYATLKLPARPDGSVDPMPGNGSLNDRVDGALTHTMIDVETITLDDVMRSFADRSERVPGSTAIWIDVEGHALEVLLGGVESLQHGTPSIILVELEQSTHWESQALATDVEGFLLRHDYVAVACDCEYPSQFNAIFARRADVQALGPLLQRDRAANFKQRIWITKHGLARLRRRAHLRRDSYRRPSQS